MNENFAPVAMAVFIGVIIFAMFMLYHLIIRKKES